MPDDPDDRATALFATLLAQVPDPDCWEDAQLAIKDTADILATTSAECEHIVMMLTDVWQQKGE